MRFNLHYEAKCVTIPDMKQSFSSFIEESGLRRDEFAKKYNMPVSTVNLWARTGKMVVGERFIMSPPRFLKDLKSE